MAFTNAQVLDRNAELVRQCDRLFEQNNTLTAEKAALVEALREMVKAYSEVMDDPETISKAKAAPQAGTGERMNGRVTRIFTGVHIDLARVVAVSLVRRFSEMGFIGVGFEIVLDSGQKIEHKESPLPGEFFVEDRSDFDVKFFIPASQRFVCNDEGHPLAVLRLQKEVDGLVQIWRDYLSEVEKP